MDYRPKRQFLISLYGEIFQLIISKTTNFEIY